MTIKDAAYEFFNDTLISSSCLLVSSACFCKLSGRCSTICASTCSLTWRETSSRIQSAAYVFNAVCVWSPVIHVNQGLGRCIGSGRLTKAVASSAVSASNDFCTCASDSLMRRSWSLICSMSFLISSKSTLSGGNATLASMHSSKVANASDLQHQNESKHSQQSKSQSQYSDALLERKGDVHVG